MLYPDSKFQFEYEVQLLNSSEPWNSNIQEIAVNNEEPIKGMIYKYNFGNYLLRIYFVEKLFNRFEIIYTIQNNTTLVFEPIQDFPWEYGTIFDCIVACCFHVKSMRANEVFTYNTNSQRTHDIYQRYAAYWNEITPITIINESEITEP